MEIPLKSVSAKVTGDINLSGFVGVGEKIGFSNIDVEISLDAPDATDEQLNTLKGAVDAHCPLVASLVNPLDLTTNLVKAEPAGSTNPSDNLKEVLWHWSLQQKKMAMPSRCNMALHPS
jgi:hypothetical protein